MLSVVIGLACWIGVAVAEDAPFGPGTPGAGASSAPAPTPYPQLTVPPPPGNGGINHDSPLLPTIKAPSPPKEQDSSALGSVENKARAPGT
ncbi:hypothetical protein [Pseudomonas sp. dw_358]|uniref:hypothetical protein n=1 Tax=Pseudomonas sp. dw_358 TaxID=2720083 RepID=UPI001BD3FCD9|nr:hypothetical protein [Pseudomonas sp. dw_358]